MASESTRDAMPDYLWMADDPDEGHCWFAAPDADAAMAQARRECIGYFGQDHVVRMVITVWDLAEGDEVIRPEQLQGCSVMNGRSSSFKDRLAPKPNA